MLKFLRLLLPYQVRAVYVCASQDLHLVTIWMWRTKVISHKDEALTPVSALLPTIDIVPEDQLQ